MKLVKQMFLSGERALFKSNGLRIEDCVFADGESPLKESNNLDINQTTFKWKYPLWYCNNVLVTNSTLVDSARSGIWYTHNIEVRDSIIEAPKTFRRASNITLIRVDMPHALESFWNCQNIILNHVSTRGDYFGLDSNDIKINSLNLTGNYCFDGCKNIEVSNSRLVSKDAFWNCENVIVRDSTIIGEYLGWNSKNITFINCVIESNQGLCYIENLKMINCKLINTTLAFEYSTVEATITSHIDSVMNPSSGTIQAISIGELIMDETKIDPSLTTIITTNDTVTPISLCETYTA